ncbi:MAG TPA: hypothetical protein VF405_16095 [Gammaproteobacteria bacterium]
MRMPFRALLVLAAGALALPILAQQGAAGHWNASVETPQGPFAFSFDFAVDGSKLTGSMNNELFGATPITDGVVNGNSISFKLTFEGAPDGGAIKISYTGTVKGDELAITSKFEGEPPGGGPAERMFTATRAK